MLAESTYDMEVRLFIGLAQQLSAAQVAWLLSEVYQMHWDYETLGQPCSSHRNNIASFIEHCGGGWPVRRVIDGEERRV